MPMTNEEFQVLVLQRFDKMDERFDKMEVRFDQLEQEVRDLRSKVTALDAKVTELDAKLQIVYEQTCELTEFHTQVNKKLDKIMQDQLSIFEVLGTHEIEIRTLRRRAI